MKRIHQGYAVANTTAQVLHALEYLQKHHIAHRDVRSDNLLLNTDGIVKVGEWNVFISFSMFPIRSFR